MAVTVLQYVAALLILTGTATATATASASQSMLRIWPEIRDRDYQYCDSWRYVIETNDAAPWRRVPPRCVSFVEEYVTGERYRSDSEAVAEQALSFARSIHLSGDAKDAWVFDVDETLLSNIPWYSTNGFGSQIFDQKSFNDWVDLAEAPALPASLRLYRGLQDLGFTIILLTGRDEFQRNSTEKALEEAGFSTWERLFLRAHPDQGSQATLYKSQKRKELIQQGFRIHGNSGDQWSDLIGYALATRSFKLPNPLYYIA